MARKKSSKIRKKSSNNPGISRAQILKLTENFGLLKGKVDEMDKNLSGNLKSLDIRVIAMHNSVKKVIQNHDDRINILENETAKIKGKTAGIALAVSVIISLAGLLIAFAKARGFF